MNLNNQMLVTCYSSLQTTMVSKWMDEWQYFRNLVSPTVTITPYKKEKKVLFPAHPMFTNVYTFLEKRSDD